MNSLKKFNPLSISLFRDSPAEGWPSMDRYADQLSVALRTADRGVQIRDLEPPTPWPIPRGMLASRLLRYPFWARRHQGDLNHVVDHSYGHLLYAIDPDRTIVTLHDLAPQYFPGRRGGISMLSWRWAISGSLKAVHLISDSDFTRQQVVSQYMLPPDKITTVHLGIQPEFRLLTDHELQIVHQTLQLPDMAFLLHVGSLQPRKNFEGLVSALSLLQAGNRSVALLQAGGVPSSDQQRLIEQNQLSDRIHFLGKVTDQKLVGLYNAADILVFPSIYEGFGLPTLEAMACGTPVIAGAAASLPEVIGEAGILVPPRDPEAWASSIEMLLASPSLMDEYKEKGIARAAQFTWARAAQKTLQVYRSVLS